MTSTTLPRSKLSKNLYGWKGGEGPSMVLIHGVGLNADAWTPIIPHLEKHFSMTALDLPGHGDSASIKAEMLQDYTQEIAAILPENSFVVGHSLGALLTLELAAIVPEKIAAIAPLNAIYQRSLEAQNAVKARAAALSDTYGADPSATLERWFGAMPEGTDKAMSDLCKTWLNTVDPKAYKQAYTLFAEANGPNDAILAKIHCSAIFITGADELNSTPEMSEKLAKAVKNGIACTISNARHMMPMTHADMVAEFLINFYQTKVQCHAKF